ncbi:MAG: diguanylate cyclase [Lachnospiraceae bacterium]|nr:diguanylate cyclase [Lachnospiraceae bacterium]
MLQEFVYANYATFIIAAFMVIFLITNTAFDKKETKLFMRAIIFAIILVIVDSIEWYAASMKEPGMLRIWMSAIGYTVRPLCVLCILNIVVRNKKVKKFLMYLPAVLNAVVAFSSLFSGIAFSYDENNQFVRGPLGWSPFVVTGLYLFILIIYSVFYFKEKNYYEALIVFAIVIAAVMSVVLEMIFGKDGLINVTIVISVTFYYLFFHTQTFKRDHLTKVLNRRSFFMDAEKHRESITGVVCLDLNYLKKINDGSGHDAGDTALLTLTKVIGKNLLKDCYLYRTGGDEFAILCIKKNQNQIEEMIKAIKEEMSKTSYSCAMGLAMCNNNTEKIKEVLDKADKAMYEDKMLMKSIVKESNAQ